MINTLLWHQRNLQRFPNNKTLNGYKRICMPFGDKKCFYVKYTGNVVRSITWSQEKKKWVFQKIMFDL